MKANRYNNDQRRLYIQGSWQRALWAGMLLTVIVIGAFAPAVVVAQDNDPEAISWQTYQEILGLAMTRLEDSHGDLATLQEVKVEMDKVRSVILANGQTIQLRPLLAGVSTPEIALTRLHLVERQLALARGDDTDTRLQALDDVLSSQAFQRTSIIARLRQRVQELVHRLLPDWDLGAEMNTLFQLGTWGVGLGAAVALLILGRYWLARFLGKFVSQGDVRRSFAAGLTSATTAPQLRHEAVVQAQAGDYREALRYLYLSTLLLLEEHDLVVSDRSRTNREILRDLSSQHRLMTVVQPIVHTFDDVWYGVRQPDEETFHQYQRHIDLLETLIQQGEGELGHGAR